MSCLCLVILFGLLEGVELLEDILNPKWEIEGESSVSVGIGITNGFGSSLTSIRITKKHLPLEQAKYSLSRGHVYRGSERPILCRRTGMGKSIISKLFSISANSCSAP